MDSFSSSSFGESSDSSAQSPEAVMDQLKAQLAQAYAEEFLEVLSNFPLFFCLKSMLFFILVLIP